MIAGSYPILEYDATPVALLEPQQIIDPLPDMPEHVVFCFFQDAIQTRCRNESVPIIKHLGSEIGPNPIYKLTFRGKHIAIIHPGVGAPLAAAFLEETIALGGRKFIACGGAGALDNRVTLGHVVVAETAIRDEGTSFHYLPPAREVKAQAVAVEAMTQVLDHHNVPYDVGKTWTTDAIYRETRERIAKRRAEGAMTVEMEAAAFYAVAEFRKVSFGQMLYGGDDVSGEVWDSRGWDSETRIRDRLLQLALEAVCLL